MQPSTTRTCKCKRCLWVWVNRKPTLPRACPKCKSYKWQEEKLFTYDARKEEGAK